HNTFAKVCLGNDERTQLCGRHKYCLQILLGIRVDERLAAGELCHFAGKPSSPQAHDRNDTLHAVALAQREDTLQHDKHAGPGLTHGENAAAARVTLYGTEPAD